MDINHPTPEGYEQSQEQAEQEVNQNNAIQLESLKKDVDVALRIQEEVEKLNQQYLSKVPEEKFQKKLFEEYAEKFQEGIEEIVKAKKELKLDENTIKTQIEALYKKTAGKDGDPGTISVSDLGDLEELSKQIHFREDYELRAYAASDQEQKNRCEAQMLLNPEGWEETVETITAGLLEAFNQRPESVLKEAMQKASLREAKEALKQELILKGKSDIDAFHAAILNYSKLTLRPKDSLLEGKDAGLIYRTEVERGKLMEGITKPRNEADKLVVEFMRSSDTQRNKILENDNQRAALFSAITNILKHYRNVYQNKAEGTIKTATGDMHTARLLALIELAGESKQYIQDLEETDYTKELTEKKPGDEKDFLVNTNFEVANSKRIVPYVPAAARTLFSGKAVAGMAFKGIAGITLLINAINFDRSKGIFNEKGAENFIKNLVSNPYIAGSGLALYAMNVKGRTPEAAKLLSPNTSDGERRRIMTADQLNKIAEKKIGNTDESAKDYLKQMILNPQEWALMTPEGKSKITTQQAEDLIKEANDNQKRPPEITPGMAEKEMGLKPGSISLPNNSKLNQARYLFYKQFLTSDLGLIKLREDAVDWASK